MRLKLLLLSLAIIAGCAPSHRDTRPADIRTMDDAAKREMNRNCFSAPTPATMPATVPTSAFGHSIAITNH